MILIGQYDSPFVRRVGIALRLYGLPFEHRPWSVWSDADKIAPYNPLRRVPVLVLDDGLCLLESAAILDALDQQVSEAQRLVASTGAERARQLRVCALATGTADKAVSLFYEPLLRTQPSSEWIARCKAQIEATLDLLEQERSQVRAAFWLGERPGHADIALGCLLRFCRDVHPDLFDATRWPALTRHAQACETMPVFQEISQPFSVSR